MRSMKSVKMQIVLSLFLLAVGQVSYSAPGSALSPCGSSWNVLWASAWDSNYAYVILNNSVNLPGKASYNQQAANNQKTIDAYLYKITHASDSKQCRDIYHSMAYFKSALDANYSALKGLVTNFNSN